MKGIAISSGEAIAKPLVLEEVSFEDMLQIETCLLYTSIYMKIYYILYKIYILKDADRMIK